ncbi:MAG: 50S ribosomal protein L25 [Candidatus Omnitrophica bacterium]|nr:50S ribosomal protein L25 [Candidatus Omnitrophota bacterium]
MEKHTLKAVLRQERGKNACKQLRDKGRIPGVVYKGGKEAISVEVDSKELWAALHTEGGEHAIIALEIKGDTEKERTVIVHEVQQDPIKDVPIHVDFHEISMTELIEVKVPINIKGEAVGIQGGGILNQVMWEIEVECRAMDLPEHIDIRVEKLNIGDSIHIKDLVLPEGVRATDDPEQVVVSVIIPKSEEEKGEDEEGAAEPELIKKTKAEVAEEEGE